MHPHRRRKKRPNYGIRTVEVHRGANGFGFTISGQQPCILSCIVTNSPADQAGLKAGDFLISVNGLSVSKVTHDAVVKLIGNSVGPIKMSIAEYYYSDSSDDEPSEQFLSRSKPRYPYRPKIHRTHKYDSSDVVSATSALPQNVSKQANKLKTTAIDKKIVHNLNKSQVYYEETNNLITKSPFEVSFDPNRKAQSKIERPKFSCPGYKTIVGYLGTIEMPNQLRPSTRMSTVCSCIRRFRQEKRSPTIVVMMVLPSCITLTSSNDHTLAIYPASRVVYISSPSDKDSCYFGLITSTSVESIFPSYDDIGSKNANRTWNEMEQSSGSHQMELSESPKKVNDTNDLDVSNSCHVFVTDSKLADHSIHSSKAASFNINCTKDIVTGGCLEFPKSSEYIVNLIQKMYGLPSPVLNGNKSTDGSDMVLLNKLPDGVNDQLMANSPQPSASSNSDSGIGFRDECGVLSDRILVVDFPAQPPLPVVSSSNHRPSAIDGSTSALDSLIQSSQISQCSNSCCVSSINETNYSPNKPSSRTILEKNGKFLEIHTHKRDTEPKKFFKHEACLNNSISLCTTTCNHSLSFTSQTVTDIYEERPVDVPDDLKPLNRSKSSDNVTDTFSVFKTPIYDANRYKISKMASKLSVKDNRSNSSMKSYGFSKGNYSHEELNSFNSDPHLMSDQVVNFGSLQELCPLQNKTFQLSAVSEPDMRFKGYPDGEGASSCSDNLCGDMSLILNDSCKSDVGSACNWASGFEKLLEDTKGCETFTEFLKKEFSAENIHFWMACEKYRKLESTSERVKEAQSIYDMHLCKGATEPVNVDSQARNITQDALKEANPHLFLQAQKQIFNLMKFDSYPRFLKSDLYKDCLASYETSQNNENEDGQSTTGKSTNNKLKKSLSNAEDRRRKSLLPWHRKNRSKSKDRGEMEYCHHNTSTNSSKETSDANKVSEQNEKDMYSSRSSLTSWDIAMNVSQDDTKSLGEHSTSSNGLNKHNFCRVILSDGATTVVQMRPNETIREMANRLLDKRGLTYSNYEVFFANKSKPIDVNKNSLELAGCEVIVEHRVVFKMDLPNKKIISVKSKPTKILIDVLRPILHKYGYKLEMVRVLESAQSNHCINVNVPVTAVDGFRMTVQLIENATTQNEEVPNQGSFPAHPSSLYEITNKLYNEVLHEKSETNRHHPSDQGSLKSEDWGSEHSSGIFGRFLRRDSANDKKNKKTGHHSRSKNSSAHGSVEDIPSDSSSKKPLIAKWKAGVKLHVANKCSESDELYEGLKRAQRSRLEDQRGTEINFELPDFLKDKENAQQENKKMTKPRSIENIAESNSKVHDQFEHNSSKLDITVQSQNHDRFNINKSIIRNVEFQRPATKQRTTNLDNSPSKSSTSSSLSGKMDYSSADNNERYEQDNDRSRHNSGNEHRGFTSRSLSYQQSLLDSTEPPPLPPKPKILPIKPSNWKKVNSASTKPNDGRGNPNMYLDQPTSSFV